MMVQEGKEISNADSTLQKVPLRCYQIQLGLEFLIYELLRLFLNPNKLVVVVVG